MLETRPVSRMRAGHEALARDILQIHSDFFMAVYGYGKMHAQLVAQGRDPCFASMFVRQVRQCFSAVWADGFPRCRHRFPVM